MTISKIPLPKTEWRLKKRLQMMLFILTLAEANSKFVCKKTKTLIMQIVVNKDFLQQSLTDKQKQANNPKPSKISNSNFESAWKLFLKHHGSKHITTSDESCSICMCELVDKRANLSNLYH